MNTPRFTDAPRLDTTRIETTIRKTADILSELFDHPEYGRPLGVKAESSDNLYFSPLSLVFRFESDAWMRYSFPISHLEHIATAKLTAEILAAQIIEYLSRQKITSEM